MHCRDSAVKIEQHTCISKMFTGLLKPSLQVDGSMTQQGLAQTSCTLPLELPQARTIQNLENRNPQNP